GQLQLVGPKPAGIVTRRQAQPLAQIEQDIRRLRDQLPAGLQNRDREGYAFHTACFEHTENRRDAAAPALRDQRDVHVLRAGLLQREAHEFTASLDARPVVQLVAHGRLLAARTAREAYQCTASALAASGAAAGRFGSLKRRSMGSASRAS